MDNPYMAVFVLPLNTSRKLGECGWEFASENRLPPQLLNSIVESLHLHKQAPEPGMEVYDSDGLKLTAISDAQGIEHLFFQLREGSKQEIERAVANESVEVFSPA